MPRSLFSLQPVELPGDQRVALAGVVEGGGELRPLAQRAGGFLDEDRLAADLLQRLELQIEVVDCRPSCSASAKCNAFAEVLIARHSKS